jgi:hypothetical protein
MAVPPHQQSHKSTRKKAGVIGIVAAKNSRLIATRLARQSSGHAAFDP